MPGPSSLRIGSVAWREKQEDAWWRRPEDARALRGCTHAGVGRSKPTFFPGLLKKYSANILLTTVFIALGCK